MNASACRATGPRPPRLFIIDRNDRADRLPAARSDDLVADLAAASQQQRLFVLCADQAEYEPLLRDLPSVALSPLFWLGQLVALGYDGFVARFDELVDRQLDAGYAVLFTERAFQLLSTLPEPAIARLMREHLPAHDETVPFQAGGFLGDRVPKTK